MRRAAYDASTTVREACRAMVKARVHRVWLVKEHKVRLLRHELEQL